jgi:hypothetical protein
LLQRSSKVLSTPTPNAHTLEMGKAQQPEKSVAGVIWPPLKEGTHMDLDVWINCLGVDPMSSVWWLQLEPALLSASVCTLAPACLQLSPHCFSIMFWTLRITRPLITGAHR